MLRAEVKPAEKKRRRKSQKKIADVDTDVKKELAVENERESKTKKPEELSVETAFTLVTQIKEKLKIPEDKQISRSYLEYACVYRGLKLTDMQKSAIKTIFKRYDKV
jgi:hypothetical protein